MAFHLFKHDFVLITIHCVLFWDGRMLCPFWYALCLHGSCSHVLLCLHGSCNFIIGLLSFMSSVLGWLLINRLNPCCPFYMMFMGFSFLLVCVGGNELVWSYYCVIGSFGFLHYGEIYNCMQYLDREHLSRIVWHFQY